MKTIKKFTFKSDKLLKNDELVNLRGGYDWDYYKCCWDDQPTNCSTCSWTNEPDCVEGAHAVVCD